MKVNLVYRCSHCGQFIYGEEVIVPDDYMPKGGIRADHKFSPSLYSPIWHECFGDSMPAVFRGIANYVGIKIRREKKSEGE